MDFTTVASTVLQELRGKNVRFAAIGGFALGFWGVNRATVDMDFLLLKSDSQKAESILNQHGYELLYQSENVLQFQAAGGKGSIDFILAFRDISIKMLNRSVEFDFAGNSKVAVLSPEDITGLKVQALHNDPARYYQDVADIEAILKARSGRVDWELVESYFELFDKRDLFNEIRGKLHAAD